MTAAYLMAKNGSLYLFDYMKSVLLKSQLLLLDLQVFQIMYIIAKREMTLNLHPAGVFAFFWEQFII